MNQQKPAVSVLWTGGKDSALALHAIEAQGYEVRNLVTFAPPNPQFLAHPVPFLSLQAKALNLPHRLVEIRAPYQEGYENAAARTGSTTPWCWTGRSSNAKSPSMPLPAVNRKPCSTSTPTAY